MLNPDKQQLDGRKIQFQLNECSKHRFNKNHISNDVAVDTCFCQSSNLFSYRQELHQDKEMLS